MFEFRRIKMLLFLMLVMQATAAAEGLPPSFTVRAGQKVTLPCGNVIDDQQQCNSTTWTFSYSRQTAAVELITLGQIGEHAKSKSDRLSVTQKCSLVIKKVTHEDVGRYDCQQWKSRQRQRPDSVVSLSVVTMTENKINNQVVWSCSVSPYDGRCPRTVKWLYVGNNVDKDHKDLQTSQSPCSASVRLQSSHFIHTSNSDLLKCEVTDGDKVQLFPFRLQPSGEKPGDDTKTTTTDSSMKRGTTTTASPISDALGNLKDSWWLFVIVPVVLVALIVTAVKVFRWKRATGNNARMNDDVGLTSNSTVAQSAPETSQDTADPEGGVSYASVNFTKKPNSEARVRTKNKDDEDDPVTYMAVKVSSTDPSSLYARIN
ncbi:uncharacterized protein LOC109138585 isoform X3 [Larimichthys crocea]|uniref:uncharacterized protein LOC109138585 isoform X3 n=1 Tax=Larimichthys crocea TaxID=215358 RepID=UPI000F5FF75E|nr:uncharacterized protein LOC109138585 isoform X3 [Larimichthys crocea]